MKRIAETDRAMRARGRHIGTDPELTALRADHIMLLHASGFEGPCEWTFDEAFTLITEAMVEA
jgi:hypothetical protein